MPTIQQNLAMIRELLDEPTPQRPSDRILFQLLGNQILHHQTQLQNSGAPWEVLNYTLQVSAGTEDYLVTAANFGKPFWVYWEDPTDPHQARVEIPFSLLQNADQFYSGPRQVLQSNDNSPTAAVIAFYKQPDAFYARVTPIPGGSATFTVWYETAPAFPDSQGSSPGLSPFHHLIRTQAAVAALPYCSWGNITPDALDPRIAAAWERRTKSLALSLTKQETQFQRQFDTYIGTLMQAGVEDRQGWGAMDDWDAGIGAFAPNQFGIG
jgi:hypothetical protein